MLAAVSVAALVPTAAQALTTKASVYYAFTTSGAVKFKAQTVSGYCWTGSAVINRKDAWRCLNGNFIHDPCFSSPLDPGYVACPNAGLTRGVKIHLTKKLPHKFANHGSPSLKNQPWNIQTASGRHWVASSGATNVVDGKPALYFRAGSHAALWGYPIRAHQPWTILWAPLNATKLHTRVRIRHVWM